MILMFLSIGFVVNLLELQDTQGDICLNEANINDVDRAEF
jgi:hypothetical protein